MAEFTRKRVLAVVAPGVATVAVVAGGASPAGAATGTETHEFDFVTSSGEAVTCVLESTRTWGGSSGTDTMHAATRVVGGPEVCYDSTAYVGAEYTDPEGNPVRSPDSGGEGGTVSEDYAVAGTKSNPRSFHRIEFNDCGYADPGLCTTPTYSYVGCAL